MGVLKRILALAVLVVVSALPGRTADSEPTTLNEVVDRISQAENQEVASLRKYTPLVEIYIQDLAADRDLGKVPEDDAYFMGRADLSQGVQFHSMLGKSGVGHHLFSGLRGVFSSWFEPDSFLRMIYPDTKGFDRQHYEFQYLRREFLGEVRCLVFDVAPKKNAGKGRFKGRIWVEDQNLNIVRFNGSHLGSTNSSFHFDSWRVSSGPGLWLPACVYSAASDVKDVTNTIGSKAQVRLWAYSQSPATREQELSRVLVEAARPVLDESGAAHDHSPLQSQRSFEQEAEENVIERLEVAGLLAPRGDVDKVLETVVNNLEVSNNIGLEPDIHCRVLLTSTLESFTAGHSIVLSRGLIDVLPDEASLATILAQELANVVLGHSMDTKYAFADRMIFGDLETFHNLSFHQDPKSEAEANQKALELLKNSPYKNALGNASLFLQALDARGRQLPHLISPHLGNRVSGVQELAKLGSPLEMQKLDQIAALPLGSRIKVDPWDDHIEMIKSKPVALLSAREKMPFEVTPFMLYLTRSSDQTRKAVTTVSEPDTTRKQ